MNLQSLALLSSILCLAAVSRNDYTFKKLYDVTVSQPSDNSEEPIVTTIGNSKIPGFCQEYVEDEDLLIVTYATPSNGIRKETTLSIVPKNGILPTLFSVIAPHEIEQGITIAEENDEESGQTKFQVQIVIPENSAAGTLKIRFLSTVDFTKVSNDPQNFDYYLASEYLINSSKKVNVEGYPLKTVQSVCNSSVWMDKVEDFLCNKLTKPCISDYHLYMLVDFYKSEVTRNCLASIYKQKNCSNKTNNTKCDSEDEDEDFDFVQRPRGCAKVKLDVKSQAEANTSICAKSINKAVGICALFNLLVTYPNYQSDFLSNCSSIIKVSQEIHIDIINTVIDDCISFFPTDNHYCATYFNHRDEFEMENCEYDNLATYFEDCNENDLEHLYVYFESRINVDVKSSKPKARATKVKKTTPKKKSEESSSCEDSSSENSTPKKEESSSTYKNIAIGVGICAVIAVCVIGGSYLI